MLWRPFVQEMSCSNWIVFCGPPNGNPPKPGSDALNNPGIWIVPPVAGSTGETNIKSGVF